MSITFACRSFFLALPVVTAMTLQSATLIVGKPSAAALATTLRPDAGGSGPGPSAPCQHPTYSTIGSALAAASPGDTIEICPALYPEQLTITKPITLLGLTYNGVGRVLIQPTVLSPTVSADGAAGGVPVEAVITVSDTKNVKIESLAIDASNNGINGCSPVVTGIHYYNSSGEVVGSAIAGAQVTNCVGENALKVGNGIGILADADLDGSFAVTIQQNTIHDFTRDGVLAIGTGVTATVTGNSIAGHGPGGGVFQFGVFIENGAVGLVTNNLIHEGSCGSLSPDDCYNARSEGVTLRAVGDGTIVGNNTITSAQSGIFINGGSHVHVFSNLISDIDYLDGIDIQGTAAGVFNDSIIENNTITNLGPMANYSCGIWEYSGTGVSGNKILGNKVSDGYCGVGVVEADSAAGNSYNNTLYTFLDSDLPSSPPPVEP